MLITNSRRRKLRLKGHGVGDMTLTFNFPVFRDLNAFYLKTCTTIEQLSTSEFHILGGHKVLPVNFNSALMKFLGKKIDNILERGNKSQDSLTIFQAPPLKSSKGGWVAIMSMDGLHLDRGLDYMTFVTPSNPIAL